MAKRFQKPPILVDRWLLRVEKQPNGCWEWTGAKWARGYGKFTLPGSQKRIAAHRWGYEHFISPIAEGFELDHLCRNTSCVNPEHLEPVTHKVNVQRGHAGLINGARQRSITHCPKGHEYTPENTYIRPGAPGRNCRKCGAIVAMRRRKELNDG